MVNTYLVHGDNPGLLSLATSEVVESLQVKYPEAQVYDVSSSTSLDSDLRQVSLFSEVEIYLHQGALTADRVKQIVEYLKNSNPSSVLVISTPKPAAALTKAVQSVSGEVITWQGKTYKDTAQNLLNKSNVPLTAAAKSLIVEHFGQEVERIPGLLEVLTTTLPHAERITPQDIQPLLGDKGTIPVWELTDAIDAADAKRALRAIDRMIPANNPVALLAVVSSHIEKMFRLSALDIRSEQAAAQFLGLKGSTYPAKKAVQTMGRYGNALPALVKLVAQANTNMKGGSPLPPRMTLEILVGRLCTYPRK